MNNQGLMFQSRNVEASKSSSGSYRYLTHTTDKAMMERKTRYEVQELFVAEYKLMAVLKFITGEDLELCIVTKSKERYVPEIGI